MNEKEFIIVLTEHRYLGTIFHPYLITKSDKFYKIVHFVKPRDLNDSEYNYQSYEKELVKIIEKYSDESLMKKFSRAISVSEFFNTLRSSNFEKQVTPFIEKCMTQVASILMLSPVRLFRKDAKYSNLYEEDVIDVQPFYGQPEFYFERTESVTRYRLKICLGSKEINLRGKSNRIITNDPCILLHRNQLISFEKLNAKKLLPFFEKDSVVVPNTLEEKYYSGFVLKTIRDFNVQAEGFTIKNADVEKRAVLSLEKSLKYEPGMVLFFEYGSERFEPSSARNIAVSVEKKEGAYIFSKTIRDFNWEAEVINVLKELGLVRRDGLYTLKEIQLLEQQNAIYQIVNWLNDKKPELEKKGICVIQDKLDKAFYTGNQNLDFRAETKGDWFDVHAIVHFGEFKIPFIKLKKYILNDIREFELPNGEIAVLPEEWFARYKGLLPFGKQKGEMLQFEKHHFTLLQDSVKGSDKSVFEKYEELINGERIEIGLPVGIKAQLREYQKEGYYWMYGLYKKNFGGCLADDMGLGKTLQTLVLLLKLKRLKKDIKIADPVENKNQLSLFSQGGEKEDTQRASLIVVPTSLVHNWVNEIRKFTPSLKVFTYFGIKRKRVDNIEKIAKYYDIILTTYGTVRNDASFLAQTDFYYLILDESQSIKNPLSKTYKAVMELRGRNRLVITGTPIENSLSDLWSQMNFLNPGILGNLPFFKRTFITPIEKHTNLDQQEKLQLIIRPFVLRRKKNEVAKDLPPLVEQVRYCPLAGEQQKLYEKEKSVIRNTILASIESEGIAKSSFVMLQGLTKLRQLANHPSLLDKDALESSGKFDEIFRMLRNILAEKHKVLIFSSFVTHLELLRERIEEENWKYSILTGQSANREKIIKEYQEDEDNRIFLISLKAGGVGLNLTEADYVFIIDPWWNPAAENQAINRAHRIGQDKHVFVYRFITENTIEEKIQMLKERKSLLADKFINSNNPFQKITREEIVELFK